MQNSNIQVQIQRGRAKESIASYEVPRLAKQTILDVVTYIQRHLDNTLAYRYSCRVGMCGTCAMTVNGIPRWTCRTQAAAFDDSSSIHIEPLRNFPVVKDLVVDMDPFFEKWTSSRNTFDGDNTHQNNFAKVNPESTARRAANKAIECIGCGVCHAACDVVSWSPQYLGPAALNRAWSLLNDERHQRKEQIVLATTSDSGCLSCHTTQSCTRHCPKELDPSGSIAGLKREALRSFL